MSGGPMTEEERDEAMGPCPLALPLLELSDRLYQASHSESIHADILAAASKEIDAIADLMDEVHRSSSAAERAVVEALMDATAHLAGSASAYRKYARRHSSVGRSEIDPFFTTRADDFDKAVERARLALSSVRGEGGDKQARPSGSAPISTDTKGTTK